MASRHAVTPCHAVFPIVVSRARASSLLFFLTRTNKESSVTPRDGVTGRTCRPIISLAPPHCFTRGVS